MSQTQWGPQRIRPKGAASVFVKATIFLLALSPMLLPPSIAFPALLSDDDFRSGEAAFAAAKAGDWARVQKIGNGISVPTLQNLLTWADLIRSTANVSFEDRANFILKNPDWPWQRRLRRLAEKSMQASMRPEAVLSWFERFKPLTNQGRRQLGTALLAVGKHTEGREVLRDAWIEGDFSATEEQDFVQRFGGLLTTDTHSRRLDRLLWEGDRDQARRMFSRVDPGDRLTADARMRLRHMSPGVDAAIARVPETRRNDPALVYERLRWQRRQEFNEAARNTLQTYPLDQVRPKKWWKERSILSRRALAEGYVSEAYRAARGHALTGGAEFADAEWLSGWIALRFLDEPEQAANHFEHMFNGVRYPISRARGAYWLGRAADSSGNRPLATRWYETAAQHPTTFYGQLATVKLGDKLQFPPNQHPTPEEAGAFKKNELVRAVEILATYRQTNRLRPFVLRVGELKDSLGWKARAAALANAYGQHDLAIAISKQAEKSGRPLTRDGYPSIAIPESRPPLIQVVEKPLVLAMVRQESAFRANAVSPAGARGLMQLMPGTASQVARKINVPYSRSRLTTDPTYNLRLGEAYMAGLLQRFNGSYVLALAGYNAGPERAARWMHAHGQARESVDSAIDWIEQIPFDETRNYVQRILESLQVYRMQVDGSESGVTIEDDLTR